MKGKGLHKSKNIICLRHWSHVAVTPLSLNRWNGLFCLIDYADIPPVCHNNAV